MKEAREWLEGFADEAARKLIELLNCENPSIALKSAELILKGAGLLREPGEAAGIDRWREILISCLKKVEEG